MVMSNGSCSVSAYADNYKVFPQVSASQAELGLYLTVNVRDVYYHLGISQLFVLILVLSF